MARSALWLLAILLLGVAPAGAADAVKIGPAPGRAIVAEPPPATAEVPPPVTGPLRPPPDVAFGCKRIWRCDAQVCEWRRGCWGVYGYVESPYYTTAFIRRQWEAHGLPSPGYQRRNRRR